jgi:two-component system, chemotaxis family, sensor kinase CheA
MNKRDEAFLARLITTFTIEAQEHIQKITEELLLLENADESSRPGYIENIFREFHSMKGAARAVSLTEIEALCQSLEGLFSRIKNNQIPLSSRLLDLIQKSVDLISDYLGSTPDIREKEIIGKISLYKSELFRYTFPPREETSKPMSEIHGIKNDANSNDPDINNIANPNIHAQFRSSFEKQTGSETIRIAGGKLNGLLLQAEELLTVKLTTSQHVKELDEVRSRLTSWQKEWKKIQSNFRVVKLKLNSDSALLSSKEKNALTMMINFCEWNNSQISAIENKVFSLLKTFKNDNRTLGGMVDNLLDGMKEVMMYPASILLNTFGKIVRDLSGDLGKSADLEIEGGDIELDRRILDEMKDPFIHLIRNSIDHGIEKPDLRIAKGKNPKGKLKISIERLSGNEISISFEDDGRGIDIDRVKKEALKKKIADPDEISLLSNEAALKLIMKSELSTSDVITDISGRGLGLAIVQEKVEKLHGSVSIGTDPGKGTCFTIHLPVTLATFRGILISLDGSSFILPTVDVERIRRVPVQEIKTVEGKETILHNGSPISLVKLSDILGLEENGLPLRKFLNVLIIRNPEVKIAFVVDEIISEQEVLVKPFNKQLRRVRNILGATILGSGKIIPILNVADLIKSSLKSTYLDFQRNETGTVLTAAPANSILIVDDSITSRILLKDILESSGYKVTSAIDGLEALTILKTGRFDAVVSDVEMPRMNGFELTKSIRADEKLSGLPVLLVTALASREDREKGIDAGANAYIIKSDFDQSNLLETIKKLI